MAIRFLISSSKPFPGKRYSFPTRSIITIAFKKVLKQLLNVVILLLIEMKLEYFDLVMLNCPTSPPPAPAEGAAEG